MTEPAPMITRADASPMMPEAVNGSMLARSSEARRKAGTRAAVGADGKVKLGGHTHVGSVHKSGRAWRARDPKGQQVGLHSSKLEAAGALVMRHEAC
jgi:hypothetical protein